MFEKLGIEGVCDDDESMRDYDAEMQATLDQSIFLENCDLQPEDQLPRDAHAIIRMVASTKTPTNRDALKAYALGVKYFVSKSEEPFSRFTTEIFKQIERYLKLQEILPATNYQDINLD